MSDQINWGIVSTGQMASDMARAFSEQTGSRALSVCSRCDAKASEFADEFGIERSSGNFREFLSDQDLDVVYIASPQNAHFRQVMAALDAGHHVVCEKPLTLNAAQARICRDSAVQKGLFLMEAVWMRFFPLMTELRRLLSSGDLGDIRMLSADFFLDIRDSSHRLLNPAMAGGALLDLGLYPLNLSRMILGPLDSIRGHSRLNDDGIDIADTMTVRSAAGGLAALACGLDCRRPREAVIAGSEACLKIHDIFFRPDTLTLNYGTHEAEERHFPFLGNGYPHEILHVEECLRAGITDSPLMPLEETINVLEMMDSIREQSKIRYADQDEGTEFRT